MRKTLAILGTCVALLLLVVAGGLVYMNEQFKSFPDFDITAEKTSIGNDEIFGWIERIVFFGPRKPATEGDEKTRAFISEKFAEFGLTLSAPEPIDVPTSHVGGWSFSIKNTATGDEIEIPTFHIPFPAPPPEDGTEAELVYVGDGGKMETMDVKGKIVVFDQNTERRNWSLYKKMFFFHDPDESINENYEPVGLEARHEREVHDKALAGGALGMVGLLSGLPWESDTYCPQMNRGVGKEMPGYWVSPGNSPTVREWLDRGNAVGRMQMDAEIGRSTTYNLRATLPGEIDEYYIVMGHHDAPFANAVQDASGMSIVLALARHFTSVRQGRPLKRGIIFLAVGAHTLGRLGEREFASRHKTDLLPKVALAVSVEHIGKELIPTGDMRFGCSDLPSPRLFVTSGSENVSGIVKSSILHNDYKRSVIIPQWLVKQATGKARGISGELYEAGLPVVGLLSNPPYIFFKEDTLETVARDQLASTTDLIISILRTADRLPLEQLR